MSSAQAPPAKSCGWTENGISATRRPSQFCLELDRSRILRPDSCAPPVSVEWAAHHWLRFAAPARKLRKAREAALHRRAVGLSSTRKQRRGCPALRYWLFRHDSVKLLRQTGGERSISGTGRGSRRPQHLRLSTAPCGASGRGAKYIRRRTADVLALMRCQRLLMLMNQPSRWRGRCFGNLKVAICRDRAWRAAGDTHRGEARCRRSAWSFEFSERQLNSRSRAI